ncbi:MAG: 3-phosphoshikimate 1-carboxyvinyltransferase [Anaerolineales bacterium]|nr:3-phosphoshikimate 1-carboxyvinyltransferase [Anaerolineales bacterium]
MPPHIHAPTLPITPISHPLSATVRVPGSKSLTNRALLVAALAKGTTTLANALSSDDSRYFADSLKRLGFSLEISNPQSLISIHGLGGHIPASRAELFVGNAGTAARFLTAMLTLGQGEYTLDGDARMRERPIGDLLAALNQLGANVEPVLTSPPQPPSPDPLGQERGEPKAGGEVYPPMRVVASGLPGGRATVAGDVSSQFLSGLLMVAPYAQSPVELIVERGLNSKPYVDMTLAVMADFGATVERDGYERFRIQPQRYRAIPEYAIESDASAASYFFAAPALCGGTVRVLNISRRSKQGDVAFLEVLAAMGCTVVEGDNWIEVGATRESPLRGVDVDMHDIPDTAQTLAAIAPFANSPTTIRGIASARLKETDRVAAMCAELARLGISVTEHLDGLTIQPCRDIRPATVRTYNDHRMAMAFALIGLKVPGVEIENPECVSKTFPHFFDVLERLQV